MQLQELGQVRQYLGHSPVFSDPIWVREASKVKPQDLTFFLARMTGHGLSKEAREALLVLQEEAVKSLSLNGLNRLELLSFNFRGIDSRFAVDELVQGLSRLTKTQAQATLLGLEMGLTALQVVEMMWGQVLRFPPEQITPLASEIIRARNAARHPRLPYVFWFSVTDLIAAPLLELQAQVETAFNRKWEVLSLEYETILRFDTRAEADSFLEFVRT